MQNTFRHRGLVLLAIMIALATFALYLPATSNDFVQYDDDKYVSANPRLALPAGAVLRWAFTTFEFYNWHPLTWISYAVDHFLWGNDPFGYHLTNIVLHALNTFLVVLLSFRLLTAGQKHGTNGLAPGSALLVAAGAAGVLFGIHPVHVESVAWIAGRKDVLCAFFFLLAMLAYLAHASRSEGRPFTWWYGASLLCYSLSLLSKSMAVTLPIVLLLLDVYPLRRIMRPEAAKFSWQPLIEKIPYFAMSMLTGIFTLMAQQAGGAVKSFTEIALAERLVLAVRAVAFYLEKFIAPSGLAPFYPTYLPVTLAPSDAAIFLALGALVYISIRSWTNAKAVPVALGYYLITLLPVLGIIKFGTQAAADRYTYLPLLGPGLLAGIGCMLLMRKASGTRALRSAALAGSVLLLAAVAAALATMTASQIRIWRDPVALWSREIAVFPFTNPIGYSSRGDAYRRNGNLKNAVADYSTALQIDPGNTEVLYLRGLSHYMLGDYAMAVRDLSAAVARDPRLLSAKAYLRSAEQRMQDRENAAGNDRASLRPKTGARKGSTSLHGPTPIDR